MITSLVIRVNLPPSQFPKPTAMGRLPANLGRGRGFFATDLQPIAVGFGKLQVFAAHFGKDCGGLWQGKPLYFNVNRCSRLWKLTYRPSRRHAVQARAGSRHLTIHLDPNPSPELFERSDQPGRRLDVRRVEICHFSKSTPVTCIEISRSHLPHPTAILLKVVCNIRRFAKGDRNLAQGEDRSWSTCRWFPRRPGARRGVGLK
jgi:hypothetical protein